MSNLNPKLLTHFGSVAHEPKYLVVFILPHEAKVVAIFPLVRHDWLKWSRDKHDTHKKTWVRV